jgi:hypothetical protein
MSACNFGGAWAKAGRAARRTARENLAKTVQDLILRIIADWDCR